MCCQQDTVPSVSYSVIELLSAALHQCLECGYLTGSIFLVCRCVVLTLTSFVLLRPRSCYQLTPDYVTLWNSIVT